jgi:hypothetical protein
MLFIAQVYFWPCARAEYISAAQLSLIFKRRLYTQKLYLRYEHKDISIRYGIGGWRSATAVPNPENNLQKADRA